MVLGFLIFLFIRDPFNSFMRKILFENSNEEIHDKIRDEYLKSLGYKILRIYNNELNNIDNVLEYLRINL